ncbi:MAG: YcjF family protein [Chthoniobacterales bacterium]
MNQGLLLHIVERLEGFVGKLPTTIQKPVLHELTPLKELFLQQRPPRFVFTGSATAPLQELLTELFRSRHESGFNETLVTVYHWQKFDIGGHGTVEVLDARGADPAAVTLIEQELTARPPDAFFHVKTRRNGQNDMTDVERLRSLGKPGVKVVEINVGEINSQQVLGVLARELPYEVRVEMVRIIGDRALQNEIAQLLIKSTAAICAAIGAQPIPLADLPILTTLQLLMVSGIMYIGGRERSMRAATEFVGALGMNVGAGMVLREGARAALKLLPGWGNVICGMIAGAGTYAIGKAASVYFIEGLSLNDARRTYLANRRRKRGAEFLPGRQAKSGAEPQASLGSERRGVGRE